MVCPYLSRVFWTSHYWPRLLGDFNRLERYRDFFAFLFLLSLRAAKVCARLSCLFIGILILT